MRMLNIFFQILLCPKSLQNVCFKNKIRPFLRTKIRLIPITFWFFFHLPFKNKYCVWPSSIPGTLLMLSSLSKGMTNDYKIVLASSLSTLGRISSEPVDLNASDLCTLIKLFFTHSAFICLYVKINFP